MLLEHLFVGEVMKYLWQQNVSTLREEWLQQARDRGHHAPRDERSSEMGARAKRCPPSQGARHAERDGY